MDAGRDFASLAAGEIDKLKRLADRALEQVDDDAFFRAPDAESNSLAVLVKHLGGNLRSRWTEFLTSDGEKPGRDRDGEFEIRAGDTRADLMAGWDEGWRRFHGSVSRLQPADLGRTVRIRGEALSAQGAVLRALAHAAAHVGQIVYVAKHFAGGDWKNLSIPRGKSADFTAALQDQVRARDPRA